MREDLADGYYRDNFLILLDFVDEQYGDILSGAERRFSVSFRSFSIGAQQLFVRLVSRKGPLFRTDRLRYPEIEDLDSAADELACRCYLAVDAEEDPGMLLALLMRAELIELLRKSGGAIRGLSNLRRAEIAERALDTVTIGQIKHHVSSRCRVYRPLMLDELQLYRLLFFGNLYQDMTEFVLADLGVVRYESYPIDRSNRRFESRETLQAAIRLYEISNEFGAAAELGETPAMVAAVEQVLEVADVPDLQYLKDRLLTAMGYRLERNREYDAALRYYRMASSSLARERQARTLDRLGRTREAFIRCVDLARNPVDEAESDFAGRFAARLGRKIGRAFEPPPEPVLTVETIRLSWPAGMRVEEAALSYYRDHGIPGYYLENLLWTGLFGLAFWDIIFMPVPGAFANRFQRGPRGMFGPEFRLNRASAIAARLRHIEQAPTWPDELLAVFDRKHGTACHLVVWKYLPRSAVENALRHVSRRHLVAIFDRMSANLGLHRAGFPDLILFQEGMYELVEVKGEGDQLQSNQRRWLRFFAENRIPARVLHIERIAQPAPQPVSAANIALR